MPILSLSCRVTSIVDMDANKKDIKQIHVWTVCFPLYSAGRFVRLDILHSRPSPEASSSDHLENRKMPGLNHSRTRTGYILGNEYPCVPPRRDCLVDPEPKWMGERKARIEKKSQYHILHNPSSHQFPGCLYTTTLPVHNDFARLEPAQRQNGRRYGWHHRHWSIDCVGIHPSRV